MSSLAHDSAFGQLVRYATRGRLFRQPENHPNFEPPWKRVDNDSETEKDLEGANSTTPASEENDVAKEYDQASMPSTRNDIEAQPPLSKEASRVLQPKKTPDDLILIDWYSTDDSANPQNWSWKKKAVAAAIINLYTFGVYSSSAIITPAQEEIMTRFNVSYAEASLGLSMYVIGYGIGPLVRFPSLPPSHLISDHRSYGHHSKRFQSLAATRPTPSLMGYTLF